MGIFDTIGSLAARVGGGRAVGKGGSEDNPGNFAPTALGVNGEGKRSCGAALVTGASSGIGEEFARELARRGMDVVLCARSEARLEALAEDIRQQYGVRADVIAADLADFQARESVFAQLREQGREVDLLVNNAGFGTRREFAQIEPERIEREIAVNCSAVAHLTRLALGEMTARGGGVIVNLASVLAFMPAPYMAVYAATKAFVLSFSRAVAAEAAGSGVRVIAVCPGTTRTGFFDVADAPGLADGAPAAREAGTVGRILERGGVRTPADVVATTMRAMENGSVTVVDGVANRVLTAVSPMVPSRLVTAISGRMMKP